MKILDVRGIIARCTARGVIREVSMALLDPQPPGTWVLVNRDMAHRTLTAEEARQIDDALEALDIVMDGGSIDHLFADLVDRTPQLPPHLRVGPRE